LFSAATLPQNATKVAPAPMCRNRGRTHFHRSVRLLTGSDQANKTKESILKISNS